MITRGQVIAAAVAAVLITLAFFGGRYSAPEVVQTRDVERVVYKDRVVEKVVTVEKKAETKIVYRDRVITKDRIVEHEVERSDTGTDTTIKGETLSTREGETVHETTKTVTLRSDWRVSLLAGASLRPPLLTIAGPLVLGFEIDRRVIGGISVGVWLNTYGAAGASLSVEF